MLGMRGVPLYVCRWYCEGILINILQRAPMASQLEVNKSQCKQRLDFTVTICNTLNGMYTPELYCIYTYIPTDTSHR